MEHRLAKADRPATGDEIGIQSKRIARHDADLIPHVLAVVKPLLRLKRLLGDEVQNRPLKLVDHLKPPEKPENRGKKRYEEPL
jgi:hypothetical protein